MIRIGVVGSGFATRVQIPGFRATGEFEVVAIASHRAERARQAAAQFGIPNAVESWQELVARPDLDAVSVVMPPYLHAPISLAALRDGKHVLCEKPFAMNEDEAREMYLAAGERGRVAMVDFEFRTAPARAWFKELVDQGFLGRLYSVTVTGLLNLMANPERPTMNWWFERSKGGSWLGASGSHLIDAVRWWFGEIRGVSGDLDTFVRERRQDDGSLAPVDVDDTFAFLFRLEGGALGVMHQSAAARGARTGEITAFGSGGTLLVDNAGTIHGAKAGQRGLQELPVPERLQATAPLAEEVAGQPFTGTELPPFTALARRFAAAIRGEVAASPSFYDGLRNQQVIDAIHRSSAERRWIDIPRGEEE
jgi:predicted dehydrogenase